MADSLPTAEDEVSAISVKDEILFLLGVAGEMVVTLRWRDVNPREPAWRGCVCGEPLGDKEPDSKACRMRAADSSSSCSVEFDEDGDAGAGSSIIMSLL